MNSQHVIVVSRLGLTPQTHDQHRYCKSLQCTQAIASMRRTVQNEAKKERNASITDRQDARLGLVHTVRAGVHVRLGYVQMSSHTHAHNCNPCWYSKTRFFGPQSRHVAYNGGRGGGYAHAHAHGRAQQPCSPSMWHTQQHICVYVAYTTAIGVKTQCM